MEACNDSMIHEVIVIKELKDFIIKFEILISADPEESSEKDLIKPQVNGYDA